MGVCCLVNPFLLMMEYGQMSAYVFQNALLPCLCSKWLLERKRGGIGGSVQLSSDRFGATCCRWCLWLLLAATLWYSFSVAAGGCAWLQPFGWFSWLLKFWSSATPSKWVRVCFVSFKNVSEPGASKLARVKPKLDYVKCETGWNETCCFFGILREWLVATHDQISVSLGDFWGLFSQPSFFGR